MQRVGGAQERIDCLQAAGIPRAEMQDSLATRARWCAYNYRLPDCGYAMRTADLMGLAALATVWAWDFAYGALTVQTAIHRLDDTCRGSEAKLERLLEARSARIVEVKGIYTGWEEFCEHLGVGAELVLRVSGFEVTEKPWATGAGTEHVVPNLPTKEAVFTALMECWDGDRPVSKAARQPVATSLMRAARLSSSACR